MRELELSSQSDNQDSENETDSDTCDSEEIDRLYTTSENVTEKLIADNKYILHISATRETESNIALALSDNSCTVHTLGYNQVAHLTTLSEHNDKIIDCRFSVVNSNLLYTGSSDGFIKLWDLRTPKKPSLVFSDTSAEGNGKGKPINCFDVSCNERLLTAGTDVYEGDAFLIFWDIRNSNLLGGYWESHTDDITQVRFHPDDKDKLISGSTDGLINLYDLTQTSEDDALIDTLNTESSVEQLLWFNEGGKYNISCSTHTFDLQLWNLDDADAYKYVTRQDIAKEIRKKSGDYIYIARCHRARNSLLLLAGSNFKNGECLRSVTIRNGNIQPATNFKDNKQIVRSSWYNENSNILLTGGESGILNVWKVKESDNFPVKRKK